MSVAIYVALSLLVGLIGRNHKFTFWGYFLGSLALSPFVGMVLVLASDPASPKCNRHM